jgi:aldose 1-epimerase
VDKHTANHGLTRWLSWAVVEASDDRVRMGCTLRPRPGYPFTLALEIEYRVHAAGLTVRTRAHNVGRRAAPFGAGQHPYFSLGTATIDPAILQFEAASRLVLDPLRQLPTGERVAVPSSAYDFRTPRPIGGLVLDACFADLATDRSGTWRVSLSLAGPARQRRIEVWARPPYRYLQLFSGETLAPERRRQGLAIEPMTCPPNAFQTGTDLLVLQPDQGIDLEWGVLATSGEAGAISSTNG